MRYLFLSKVRFVRAVWLVLLLLGVSTPGAPARTFRSGQASFASQMSVCRSNNASPDAVIAACTYLIGLNRFNARQLVTLLEHRGSAYAKDKAYEPAIADFTESIQLVPDYAMAYWNRAVMYREQGDLKSALADFLEFRQRVPNDPLVLNMIGQVQQILDAAVAQARAIAGMSSAETAALQQRLTDDGCYRGPLDGKPSQALNDAVKACPSQDPSLRIETGNHTAVISSIRADAQCRVLATTSTDKTTRVWSAVDGHLLHTLRTPSGAANGGAGFAVAVSPDGRYVATAGYDAQLDTTQQTFIYVFDASTGELVARPFGFTNVVRGLAFSPDGRWLAAVGGQGQSGVRVYDSADWHLAMSDLDYNHKFVYAVTFGPDGDLYTAGYDGGLRRYGSGPLFAREQMIATGAGSQPLSVAVDPRGELLAVGFEDVRGVAFYDAKTLRLRFGGDAPNAGPGVLSEVAWSSDGSRLYAAGTYAVLAQSHWTRPVLSFDRNGRPNIEPTTTPDDTIAGLTACGSGMALASGTGFGILDPSGMRYWHASTTADMRGKVGNALTIAPDAKRIRFGLGFAEAVSTTDYPIVDPVVFDLSRGTLDGAPQPIPGFIAPVTTTLPVDRWRGQRDPTFAGGPLALDDGEGARSLAIRPDGDGFVLGTSFWLRAYARDGSPQWQVRSPSDAWGVDVSENGRIVVAADGDGTIRWHRWSDGKELLALFVDRQTKRWVAWTPKGYYMASPGGEDLIGWHVNRGWDQAADFFPASRFRARFNRPDIVRLVLDTLDEDQAVRQANAAAGRTEDAQPLIAHLPPLIRVLDPAPGTHVASGSVTIGYSFRSPSGLPVDRIVVDVNGRPVKEIGLPVRALTGDQETTGTVVLTLGARESDVGLIAWSGDLASQVAHVTLTWDGAPATTSAMRKLHVLVAGVSAYADPDMRLDFAAKDAEDFAKALEAQKGVYYGDVETRVLTDGEVTRASLTQGLDWLKTVATGPDDVSILFLAGHGLTDAKGTYWFFPADANADDMGRKGVSQEEIRKSLQGLKGKVLWFLDTCHAGAAATRAPADMNVLLNTVTAAEDGGIVVFASSTGREVSIESKDLGNGAFTKALVEGIEQGKAAFLHQLITTSSLDGFVESRVKELTGDKQTPVMERPPQEPDFTIGGLRRP